MVRKSLLTAAVLLLIGSSVAGATTTLATPPLPGGGTYECSVLNVGTRAIEVDIGIFSKNSGSVVHLSCMGLATGKVCSIESQEGSNASYCLVTIVKGSKKSVRASLTAKIGGSIAATATAQ